MYSLYCFNTIRCLSLESLSNSLQVVSSGLNNILGLQRYNSSVRVGNEGSNNGEGIGETSIPIGIGISTGKEDLSISLTLLTGITSGVMDIFLSSITGSIMDIRLSYGVDQSSGKRMVCIWQGIRISTRKKDLSLTLLTGITGRVMDISLSFGRAVIRNITSSIVNIGRSFRGAVIGSVTCSIVDIRFGYRVDKTSVKGIVGQRQSSIGIGSKA